MNRSMRSLSALRGIESEADFDAIPADEIDIYVGEHTDFVSWVAMLQAAGREYLLREMAERTAES